ncbi:hypothetical protein ACEOHC_003955 [Salmonella enterica]
MKLKDKADKDKRFKMVIIGSNRTPIHPLTREESWNKTLEAFGVPLSVRNADRENREKANRLAESGSDKTTWFEWEGLRIEYRQVRIS